MRRTLVRHPASRCDAVRTIEVDVTRAAASQLRVRYLISGNIGALRLPSPTAPTRADDLWRHTCLEAFARDADGEGYVEFNLSPSTQWAIYRFDRYREGIRACDTPAPRIEVIRTGERLEPSAVLALREPAAWLALSAVIEDASGDVSYWALQHPPGKADFHHPDGFALRLPAPSAP